jgi:hypothetical protein
MTITNTRNITWVGYGCDFYYNIGIPDLKVVYPSTFIGCILSCSEDIRCTHFNFNGNIEKCFIKSGEVERNKVIFLGENIFCGIMSD